MSREADSNKWSRNLSDETANESNRLRLINRQKQILENKRQRQQQIVATSTRDDSRPIKSASAQKSIERISLINTVDHGEPSGVVNPSLSLEDVQPRKSSPLLASASSGQEEHSVDLVLGQVSPIDSSSPDEPSSPLKANNLSKVSPSKSKGSESEPKATKGGLFCEPIPTIGPEQNPLTSNMSSKELLAFSVQIIPQDQVMQCTIIRDKRGLDRSLYPTYFLHLQAIVKKDAKKDDTSSPTVDLESEGNRKPTATIGAKSTFILCGRRRKKSKTYLVSSDPYDISRVNCIAKVKSNVLGTQFNSLRLNSSGQRFEMSTIIYEANVLGFKGPRKMTVLLPQPDEEAGVSLHDAWKRNKNVIVLKNKAPVWNDESQSYVLNFHGRVTQASVKNFQLVRGSPDEVEDDPDEEPVFQMANKLKLHERGLSIPSIPAINFNPGVVLDEDIVMQFGRVSDKEFTCDVTHPLTILQAFTIALSSFDSKLACE